MLVKKKPKVIVISQWPNVKNAEYQLIESIKKSDCTIKVTDCLGFDVESGVNYNTTDLSEDFDFAIALHFDTPKLLNITTYLWIANPLEYLYLKNNYSYQTLYDMLSFDSYLFNGSEILKKQIKSIVGESFKDYGFEFYPSSSVNELMYPIGQASVKEKKLFYCGINWEAILDGKSRHDDFLYKLSELDLIHIYGPEVSGGCYVWKGFKAYRGEIEFNSSALKFVMRNYSAVLALSSPAHIKSKTSSSRVFEAIAAGVPVISDQNEHVKKLFGDTVYYFSGGTSQDRIKDIQRVMSEITRNPEESEGKVKKAQALLRDKYSFDYCLDLVWGAKSRQELQEIEKCRKQLIKASKKMRFQIFYFHCDEAEDYKDQFPNYNNCLKALEGVYKYGCDALVTFIVRSNSEIDYIKSLDIESSVVVDFLLTDDLTESEWCNAKLGEKIASMIPYVNGDYVVFINEYEYMHNDFFTKKITETNFTNDIYISGAYENDFNLIPPDSTESIKRYNYPYSSYKWSQRSVYDNHMGRVVFPSKFLNSDFMEKIFFFDFLLPIVSIFLMEKYKANIYRSRYITMSIRKNIFKSTYEDFINKTKNGFWSSHYDFRSNYNHEINAGYDLFYSESELLEKWSLVRGTNNQKQDDFPQLELSSIRLLNFMVKIARPIYRVINKLKTGYYRLLFFSKSLFMRDK